MSTRGPVVVLAFLIAGFLLVGCDGDDVFDGDGVRGSGTLVSESRQVSGFTEIVLLGSGDVMITVGETESLTIEAEDNIMPLLTTEVRNGSLELGSDSNYAATKGIIYTITTTELDGVTINGSGNIAASGLSGGSFAATVNGSGDIEPVGNISDLTVNINGSGSFKGEALIASSGTIEVAGSGSGLMNVTDELAVLVAGSGDVEYLGSPSVAETISGSGSVSQR